ncbi:metal ABC transporter ATP-binding protein [Lipingzhangella sp. LS1_29]|uniref:Metal ABC transporter ATP-binding protein n=1 Tax=Lipingzhangella rawalii TaxID=2055835 RepID=A0ABU2H7B7_9ACTN|nr:metal ABC transporter ATP-binding protein [Lipingzhangella rawalii]MDS1271212.1 metal ABC transporter ATP-binding protein [Lipingzhangella rawalii]
MRHAVAGYEHTPVLRNISVDICTGETVAVMGANGSGKSTLMRALLGIVPLTSGSVEIHGTPLRRFRQWPRIGYVPQRLAAGGGVPATVGEVVASGGIARHWSRPLLRRILRTGARDDRRLVTEALDSMGLTTLANRSVHELSGGQQQRVLIARALAGGPDTLLLDEPMAGVDAANQQALADALERLTHRGYTIVLVLHELGPLAPLVHRAVVLSDGRITHDGPPPQPTGDCAAPGHEHIHPHAGPTGVGSGRDTLDATQLGGLPGA